MDFGRCRIIESWADWEYSLHNFYEQIDRQGWAMRYPFDFVDVDEETKSARFSSTSNLPYYSTTLKTCNCYDFQSRWFPCKHIYRLAVELNIIEIIKRPSFDKELVAEIRNLSDVDSHYEQIGRQERAMNKKCIPTDINFDDKTASFAGSGKSLYKTTLESCTCRDFFVRRLPCKHIYRLRYELNRNDR